MQMICVRPARLDVISRDSQYSLTSSSSLPLPQAEVDEFKTEMIEASRRERW